MPNHRGVMGLLCLFCMSVAVGPAGAAPSEQAAPEGFYERQWPAISKPHTAVTLSSKLDENIVSIPVKEGEPVTKGQVLLKFDARLINERIALAEIEADFEARIQAAQAQYEFLKREYERSSQLRDLGVTESELDKAHYDMEKARLDLEELKRSKRLAEQQLRYLRTLALDYTIVSPIDGVVSHVWVEEGEMASQGQHLLEVIDPKVVEVLVHLPEAHTDKVHVGQQVTVLFGEGRKVRVPGRVWVVAPYVDSSSGTFAVKVLCEPDRPDVKPGMACCVQFHGPGRPAVASERG